MENQLLLMVLFLAIVLMAAYYYVQRAKRRGTHDATDAHVGTDDDRTV